MRKITTLLIFTYSVFAQPPVAPTPQAAGAIDGNQMGNYNIADSAELGYRFNTTGGNDLQYRSVVNYGNGIRLLGSSFAMNSRDGHGPVIDQLRITTQGLGNDPYQNARILAERNGLYRYDFIWRQNDYVNPGLVTGGADGQHLLDTRYRMQDHNLTLFPQSKIKFFLGVSLSSRDGTGNSSIVPTTLPLVSYPLFADIKTVWREYRVGNEFRVLGMRVNWIRGWEDFKDDTTQVLAPGSVLAVPPQTPPNYFASFQGASPTHGTSPYWRVNVFRQTHSIGVNGQFSYTAGSRGFVVDERASGAQPGGPLQNVISRGLGQRPVATGNLNLSFTPTSRLAITNATSFYNVRTLGNSTFTELDEPGGLATILFYNYLGIRTIANDTNLNYQVTDWIGFTTGFHYSDRLIRSVEQFSFGTLVNNVPSEQGNTLLAGDVGIRLHPWRPLTVILSAQIGSNSRPFTPTADRDYHTLNGRVQYRRGALQLSAAANTRYNVNSVALSSYESQSRLYAFDGSWSRGTAFGVDASYSRNHGYSVGGIAYFADEQLQTGQSSIYLTNINTIYIGLHGNLIKRLDWNVGYSYMQDVGDGRSTLLGSGAGSPNPVFQAVQTFPVLFESPSARASVRLRNNLRWNVGYQYYGYSQKFSASLDFRAHTGYTSLSVSF